MKAEMPLLHSRAVPPGQSGTQVSVTARQAKWDYVGFTVRQIARGDAWSGRTGRHEACLVLLSGLASVSWSPDQRRPLRLGPRRDVFTDYPHALYLPPGPHSRCAPHSAPRLLNADRQVPDIFRRGRSDRRIADWKCAAAEMPRARSSTFCQPPRRRIVCSCVKSLHRRETGRAILRTNTIATRRRSKRTSMRPITIDSAVRTVRYSAPLHCRWTFGSDAQSHRWRSRDRPRRVSPVRRGAGIRRVLPEHARRQLPLDGGDR